MADKGKSEKVQDAGTVAAEKPLARPVASNGKPPVVKLHPRERFRRYAEKRTGRALKALAAVGQFGVASSYEMTEPEREAIIVAIDAAVKRMTAKMRGERDAEAAFKLF